MNDAMAAPASFLREVPRVPVAASVAQRHPIFIILGMHRSGTSLCSHVLSALGVDMADQLGQLGPSAFDNPKGHWERWEIVDLNERILGLLNRSYGGPMHDFGFPVAWWADPEVAQVRREIVEFLRQRMGEGYFGFKDPRTVRLMPLWNQVANELKLAPKIVFCLRNPAQVARSLQVRDGLDLDVGEARWFSYVIDFFRYNGAGEFCVIEYEAWFDDISTNLHKLRDFLGLEWQQTDLELTLAGIVEAQLRHDDSPDRKARQPLVRSLYKLARRADRDLAARSEIQTIVAQFIAFQQLQGGIQRGFEQIAAAAARLPAIEQDATTLRNTLAEREAREAEVVAELERAQKWAAELVRERDEIAAAEEAARVAEGSLRSALGEAERRASDVAAALAAREAQLTQSEAGREAALAASQVEIAGLRESLAQAEQRVRQGEAALAASQVEIAGLRESLAQAEQRVQQGETALAESQVEIAGLRESLAQAEQRVQQREAAVANAERHSSALRVELGEQTVRTHESRSEVAKLQERLGRAEQETERRRIAEEAAHVQVAALRDELAAARQVGKSLLDALRAGPLALPTTKPVTKRRRLFHLFRSTSAV